MDYVSLGLDFGQVGVNLDLVLNLGLDAIPSLVMCVRSSSGQRVAGSS